jgi:replication factor A1
VDKFYEKVEIGKVYLIGNCVVKSANKKFSSLKNDYEISFTRETIVDEVEDTADVPEITYDLKLIEAIKDTPVEEIVDIVAVCHACSDVQTIITRATNKELKKREVTLVDESKYSVTLTMWGKEAEEFNIMGNPIIAIRRAKVGEYQNNKNVSLLMSSNFFVSFLSLILSKLSKLLVHLQLNPNIAEAHHLRGWYDNVGSGLTFTGLSSAGGSSGGGCKNACSLGHRHSSLMILCYSLWL